jgi:hypothetical protein
LEFSLSKLAIYIDPFIGFVMPDREKGLKQAVSKNFTAPQYFCQRHVKSYLKKIKDTSIQNIVCQIFLCRKVKKYEELIVSLKSSKLGHSALLFLEDVGLEKVTYLKQTIPRYNVLTSNNIESMNACIWFIREYSLLDRYLSF